MNMETKVTPESRARGIQSIEIGHQILLAIMAGPPPLTLKTIAERAGLSASATHNYLTSYIRTGVVAVEGRGQYRLGPSLAALGMAAMKNGDSFESVRNEAVALSELTGRGVAVSVWEPVGGTVIIFHKQGLQREAFDLRSGPVSTVHTGAGNVFIAYLEAEATLPVVLRELQHEGLGRPESVALCASIREAVLSKGYAVTELKELPGYTAVSCAVWDETDRPKYALTVTGPQATIDSSPDSVIVLALRESAASLSRNLGAPASRWANR